MEGTLIDDQSGSNLNDFLKQKEWEIVNEKQRFCDYWESHLLREGKCVLCEAKHIGWKI
jgi:hypothetical protein